MTVDLAKKDKEKLAAQVVGRVYATGIFKLQSPAIFGSGRGNSDSDLTLGRGADGSLLIPGASLAGACRSFLTHYLLGSEAFGYLSKDKPVYEAELRKRERAEHIHLLFGANEQDDGQSALLISDAYIVETANKEAPSDAFNKNTTIRDGVKIDAAKGQAKIGAKYDFEVIEPGTEFTLKFELVLRRGSESDKLKQLLNILLAGFEQGEIRLGAKTRRGMGRGTVGKWGVQDLDFSRPQDVLEWLKPDLSSSQALPKRAGSQLKSLTDKRNFFDLKVTFALSGSVLVRSYVEDKNLPDSVQLKSHNVDNNHTSAVLPATALAGVLRHRAERIVRTLVGDVVKDKEIIKAKVNNFLHPLFGPDDLDTPTAKEPGRQMVSRLRVEEACLGETIEEIQTRIKIDRFTGGVLPGALFDEMPVWAKDDEGWLLECRLWQPSPAEIGLLLYVIKDMWVGDLTVGSGAGIGRGTMRGLTAELIWHKGDNLRPQSWRFKQADGQIAFSEGNAADLEVFAQEFNDWVAENQLVLSTVSG